MISRRLLHFPNEVQEFPKLISTHHHYRIRLLEWHVLCIFGTFLSEMLENRVEQQLFIDRTRRVLNLMERSTYC